VSVKIYLSRRQALPAALACAALLLLSGCSRSSSSAKVHEMGEEIAVGSLVYLVTQTTWSEDFAGEHGARVPANKFFLVNVTVKNAGRDTVGVPLLAVLDASGKEVMELDKGEGAPEWLGALRTLAPGDSIAGNLLFDVPQSAYKLRISSGGDVEKETTALVNLPYSIDAGRPGAADALPTPPAK
jgi:hypothetical protein